MSDLHLLMEKNSLALQRIADRTRSLRSKHTNIDAPASILERSLRDNESVLGTYNTDATETSFLFDDLIVNSKVYRRVLARAHTTNLNSSTANQQSKSSEPSIVGTWRSSFAAFYTALTEDTEFQALARQPFQENDWKDFEAEASAIAQWYKVISENERMSLLYRLLGQHPEMRLGPSKDEAWI